MSFKMPYPLDYCLLIDPEERNLPTPNHLSRNVRCKLVQIGRSLCPFQIIVRHASIVRFRLNQPPAAFVMILMHSMQPYRGSNGFELDVPLLKRHSLCCIGHCGASLQVMTRPQSRCVSLPLGFLCHRPINYSHLSGL
jgi:hypothetical protein